MYCFNVVDGCVIERTFRKKCRDDSALVKMVRELVPNAIVATYSEFTSETYPTLYEACCALTEYAEDIGERNWFVSVTERNVEALAIVRVIDVTSQWKVLMDKDTFEEWVKTNVR